MRIPTLQKLNEAPSVEEVKQDFRIPRKYLPDVAEWLGLSESMVYQISRGFKTPSKGLQQKLARDLCIPIQIWTLDNRAEILYDMWYKIVALPAKQSIRKFMDGCDNPVSTATSVNVDAEPEQG